MRPSFPFPTPPTDGAEAQPDPHFCLDAHLTRLELARTTEDLSYDPLSPGRRLMSLPVTR